MALCWPSLILLVYAYIPHVVSAANFTLTTELTNFIPGCAQECFLSFLDNNFDTPICSTKPTLDCLCSHNTTTGYTVGEGAVQCIISETNIGFCQGKDATSNVVQNAFQMCNGQEGALPNTHGTITATLIVQTSMPSIVLVAPPTSTSNISTRASSTASITSTTAISNQPTTTFSTLSTRATTATSTSTILPVAASETATPTTSLSKTQIIGITAGTVGGGALAIGILLIFCCWRKRRQRRARDSDMLPFQLDPPAYTIQNNYNLFKEPKKSKRRTNFNGPPTFKGPTERGPGGTGNGIAAKVPPRVPIRLDTSSPNLFSRRSIVPDPAIGVAISPENNVSVEKQQRRASRLLPEKPTLMLQLPPQRTGTGKFNNPQPKILTRESTATQFEEDYDESADTVVATDDSFGRKSTDKILPPSSSKMTTNTWQGQTIRAVPAALDSAPPAFLITGGDGNHWRPGQPSKTTVAAPDYYIRPLNLEPRKRQPPVGSFSQPRAPSGQQPTLPQLDIPDGGPLTAASSDYSTRGSVPSNPARDSAPRQRRSYNQIGPYDQNQNESAVSAQEDVTEKPNKVTDKDLSPVVESPASGGVSPVSYPKIPKRLSINTIRMVPPPPQPDFTKPLSARADPRSYNLPPWRQAELQAQRERERQRLESQLGMQDVKIKPTSNQSQAYPRKPSRENKPPVVFNFPTPPAAAKTALGRSQSQRVQLGYQEAQLPPRTQTQTAPLTDATGGWGPKSQLRPSATTNLNMNPNWIPQNPLTSHPSITFTRSSSTLSQYSQMTQNSTSSSLLAKRQQRGAPQNLALKTPGDTATAAQGDAKKWRVLGKEERELAKNKDWKPMLGSGNGPNTLSPNGKGGENIDGHGGKVQFEQQLPPTPGWAPRLTPTRRGDELFLSVQ